MRDVGEKMIPGTDKEEEEEGRGEEAEEEREDGGSEGRKADEGFDHGKELGVRVVGVGGRERDAVGCIRYNDSHCIRRGEGMGRRRGRVRGGGGGGEQVSVEERSRRSGGGQSWEGDGDE